jgi:hypothetical protein
MDGGQRGELLVGVYLDPVRPLLTLGKPQHHDPAQWVDYAARFGIGAAETEALIRMACDPALLQADNDSPEVWAPVHAWRALGQLRAEAATAPLVALLAELETDDAAEADLPAVFGMIGPSVIAPLAVFLAAPDVASSVKGVAMMALKEITARHPAARDDCVAVLARVLETVSTEDSLAGGFAVGTLLDLHAVEAIDAIRGAFARGAVDDWVAGDLEDVEIELGLRAHRATKRRRANMFFQDVKDIDTAPLPVALPAKSTKIGRNEPCPCGSGKKYKKCCLV